VLVDAVDRLEGLFHGSEHVACTDLFCTAGEHIAASGTADALYQVCSLELEEQLGQVLI
jgi:hypothetical protein